MKPPPFRYHDPASLAEAIAILSRSPNAKVLAGGQSLMPMLNMRFLFPDDVVDLARVDGLAGIEDRGGTVSIGAMTRQRDLERSPVVAAKLPMMAEALFHVGHRQTRNRGTLGGSLAHLDPAAELPLVAAAHDATVTVAGPDGEREIPFAAFPLAYMIPAIAPDEILTRADFPVWPAGSGAAFVEYARRHGDYAIVAAAALVEIAADGTVARAALALGGVGEVPARVAEAEALLVGRRPDAETIAAAARPCGALEALDDAIVPASYRRHLAVVMARRALGLAAARAGAERRAA